MNVQRATPRFNLQYCVRLMRVREWWDKLFHLAGSVFLLWDYSDSIRVDVTGCFIFLSAAACLLTAGYTMNDVGDAQLDKIAGRSGMPTRNHSLFVSIAALITSLVLIGTISNGILPCLITTGTIIIGLEYSLPPLRFKERGIWGVIVGSATQRPLIFLIFVVIIWEWNWLSAVLAIWLFFGGMLGMLGHQIIDYHNDLISGARTFVARHGPRSGLVLSIVCATIVILTTLAPIFFVPVSKALPIICLFFVLSSVFMAKGLKSLGKLREAAFQNELKDTQPPEK